MIHSYDNGLGYGYGSWVSVSKSISAGTAYEITSTMKSGNQTVVVDGVTVHTATVSTTYNTGLPMYIFGSNYGGTFDFKAKAKLYWMKIYENDVLVRDMWPCYDPDGVLCLYDKVEKKYYYNAGSGEFTTEGGEVVPTTHTVTMVGGFDDGAYGSRVWVVINGTRYGTAGTVEVADLSDIVVWAYGESASIVRLNGENVLADYGGNGRGYPFVLTKDCTIKDATASRLYALAEITM